jgi:hypothetical protein
VLTGQRIITGWIALEAEIGHRILRLLRPGTDLGSTCRPVPSGVVLCRSMTFRREQSVSRDHTLRHEQENHSTG